MLWHKRGYSEDGDYSHCESGIQGGGRWGLRSQKGQSHGNVKIVYEIRSRLTREVR